MQLSYQLDSKNSNSNISKILLKRIKNWYFLPNSVKQYFYKMPL